MGRSIDLYSYDASNLINGIMDYCKTDNHDLVKTILSEFGTFVAGEYIILNQELWEDYSCYYNVAHALDRIFGVEDSFGEIFCTIGNKYNITKKELISAIETDEAMHGLFGAEWREKYPKKEDE